MYHGIPLNYDLLVFVFAVIVWIIRGIGKAIKQVKRPVINTPLIPQAPPLPQTLPARTVPLVAPRETPRQPQAGGPAVLNAPQPALANLPLVQPNNLFSGTDDLVRAVILQEVLGPPLCRKYSASSLSAPPPQ